MPTEAIKPVWATPDMNSFTTATIHKIRYTNFPGIVGGVTQQFQKKD